VHGRVRSVDPYVVDGRICVVPFSYSMQARLFSRLVIAYSFSFIRSMSGVRWGAEIHLKMHCFLSVSMVAFVNEA